MSTDIRQTGKVKFFDSRKGWGFIRPDQGDKDVFLSNTRLPSGITTIDPETPCSFTIGQGKKGLYAKEFTLL